MHPHFYHWHSRVEPKPNSDILEPRWEAATKFAAKATAEDIKGLLRLFLFAHIDATFAARFSAALVKLEPTFPVSDEPPLLRVMAAAAIYSRLEKPSRASNALALGIRSACFPESAVFPVCGEVITAADDYVHSQSEEVRPNSFVITPGKAEKNAETYIESFKKAAEDPAGIAGATEALAKNIFGALKDSNGVMASVVSRIAEENQFLWWLIGRRSLSLAKSRSALTRAEYALVVAEEAAQRVELFPPSTSIEYLIGAALDQCGVDEIEPSTIAGFIGKTPSDWSPKIEIAEDICDFVPILRTYRSSIQSGNPPSNHPDISETVLTGIDMSRQCFREMVFIKSLNYL